MDSKTLRPSRAARSNLLVRSIRNAGNRGNPVPLELRRHFLLSGRILRSLFLHVLPAFCTRFTPIYRPANSRNVGQFGPVVCPPLCCRQASSPSTMGISTSGNSAVPRSFLPSRRYTGPAATAAWKLHRWSTHWPRRVAVAAEDVPRSACSFRESRPRRAKWPDRLRFLEDAGRASGGRPESRFSRANRSRWYK